MTQCDKTVTLAELPTCDDVPRDSFLIVQGDNTACKVKVSDLVLGSENIDFYPELTEILNRLDLLESIMSANSANWTTGYGHAISGKDIWNQIPDLNIQDMKDTLDNNKDDWSESYTTVANNSGSWGNAANEIEINSDNWTTTYETVNANESNWNTAYVASTNGFQAIAEAMEMIETSPWFTIYTGGSAQSVYTTVNMNSASW